MDAQASQDEMIVTDWLSHIPKPNLPGLTDLTDIPDQVNNSNKHNNNNNNNKNNNINNNNNRDKGLGILQIEKIFFSINTFIIN